MYPVIYITVRFLKNMLMAAWSWSSDHYSKRSTGNGCIHTCLRLSPKELLKQVKTNKTINKDAIRPLRRHEQRDQLCHLWHYSLLSTLMALGTGRMKTQSTGPKKPSGPSSCWHNFCVTAWGNGTAPLWRLFLVQQLQQQVCCGWFH